MNEPGKIPPALTSTSIASMAPVTAMKRTLPPIFCEEGSIADGAADQENCRLDRLFQVPGLKNGFAPHCTTLT